MPNRDAWLDIGARPLNIKWNYFSTNISGSSSHILEFVFRWTSATSNQSAGTITRSIQLVYSTNGDAVGARGALTEGVFFGPNNP